MKLFYWLRVNYKLFKRKHRLVNSFCRNCGRDVHDFLVDNEVWNKVQPLIKNGNTLCYDCFCEKCGELGLDTVWRLVKL